MAVISSQHYVYGYRCTVWNNICNDDISKECCFGIINISKHDREIIASCDKALTNIVEDLDVYIDEINAYEIKIIANVGMNEYELMKILFTIVEKITDLENFQE